jgi:uncharacterized protein (DUF608 family)
VKKISELLSRYSRREFIANSAITGASATLLLREAAEGSQVGRSAQGRLFPRDLPALQWAEFQAAGFAEPVSGCLYRGSDPPCCGLALGGIDTGCIDVDVQGVYGLVSIFNPASPCPAVKGWRMPRKPQTMQPILGLSSGGKTWVLSTKKVIEGGEIAVCQDPFFGRPAFKADRMTIPHVQSVSAVHEIHYWGHYPVVDMEFETDAPLSVGLRAWSPFLPGDVAGSSIPAAMFEVHVRNPSNEPQQGTLGFHFPGPDEQEAGSSEFTRRAIHENFEGIFVASKRVNYVLGVIEQEKVRFGGGLSRDPSAWSRIHLSLPGEASHDASSSCAVDLSLRANEEKKVRFLLAWFAPVWEGAARKNLKMSPVASKWIAAQWGDGTNHYTHMYAARYDSALDVARRMAAEHEQLLTRVLAWQSIVYGEREIPVWLRDALVNDLYLLTECSVWAQAKAPLQDSAFPEGAFGLIESPRGDPDVSCIPCDWYGNLPLVYFFPELAHSTLKTYKALQRDDGAAPFLIGALGDLPDFATPSWDWQISLNGTCYVDLVDRLWQRTGNDELLNEFYDSVKRCNTMTMNLRHGPGAVISMPDGNKGMEWFEHGEWAGMCSHMGGLHLAQLRMMERMARQKGDPAYVAECQKWLADGSQAMEQKLWTGTYYLNFFEEETGKKSDDVMAYQLDGQWTAQFHGLPVVFTPQRAKQTLETIQRRNVALTPQIGAANFTKADGSPLEVTDKIAYYGPYAMFTAEVVVLGMTYIYAGLKEIGVELVRRHWSNLFFAQKHPWDMPNLVRGDTGERIFGTDYYQCMMLWALPAAMADTDLRGFCGRGGLIDRMIAAACATGPRPRPTARTTAG